MSFILAFIVVLAFILAVYAYSQNRLIKTLLETNKHYLSKQSTYQSHIDEFFTKAKQLQLQNETLHKETEVLRAELFDIKSKQQSKSVRLGLLSENVLPLHVDFGIDYKCLVPMFRPIDYISFEEDKITFIEIKMGTSKLSDRQKNIRGLIEQGKVYFKEIRVSESGLEEK